MTPHDQKPVYLIPRDGLPWAASMDRNAWPFYAAFRFEWDDTRGFHEVRDTRRYWTQAGALKRAAELNAAE